jgi:hypothetical protein
MPAGKLPTPQDAAAARRIVLDGLARDADIHELVRELEPWHPRHNTFPGEVFLQLAADALQWCGASQEEPLALEGIQERFLPECTFRGRENHKFQFAVLAAAALHGGAEPDLLAEVAWWQTDDFWQYALFAAVAYIRAAADKASVPIRQACPQLVLPAGDDHLGVTRPVPEQTVRRAPREQRAHLTSEVIKPVTKQVRRRGCQRQVTGQDTLAISH